MLGLPLDAAVKIQQSPDATEAAFMARLTCAMHRGLESPRESEGVIVHDQACGREVVAIVHQSQVQQEQIELFRMSAIASLILCAGLGISGCTSSHSSISTDQHASSQHTSNAPSEETIANHVSFWKLSGQAKSWIYLAVPPKTSEGELTNILWYVRDKVQSHRFHDLGLSAAEAARVERFSYGSVTIYRSKNKWKSEKDRKVPTAKDPPAAMYMWGDDGDRSNDSGSLFEGLGNDVSLEKVFDSSDHWVSSGMAASGTKSDDLEKRDARFTFAVRESGKYGRSGLPLNAYVDGRVLVLQGPLLTSEDNRVRVYKEFMTEHGSRLCDLNFTAIKLVPSKADTTQPVGAGRAYPVPCAK
jgi:hypothetical protein